MMNAKQFVHHASETQVHCYERGWIPARPEAQPFKLRFKDAMQVLFGNAEAVKFDKPVAGASQDKICEANDN